MSEWLWRYGEDDQALWKIVIQHKYGQDSQWYTKEVTSPYGVSTWRSIRSLWTRLAGNIKLKIGNGAKILFWKDVWAGQETLMHTFPDLFCLCNNTEVTLVESWSNGRNITFRRNLNDWEIDWVAQLLQSLNEFKGFEVRMDTISWKHSKDGSFTVNRLYKRNLELIKLSHWLDGNKYG